ncbi:hypothetical protein [Sphingopyxis sp. PET50]|uniref:hypothetical protein n=1 Tax=Sphingopyxis sp. PET50 TaxID=2976533 RepID=UPI0021B03D70|nr:hypothetical protein [Sphingopyxis sp. PET50]
MVLRIFMAIAAAAAVTASSAAAEPAKAEGDAFEILNVALELGSACKSYRGFEYHYLNEAAGIALEKSATMDAYGAARKAAEERGADTLNMGMAAQRALYDHGARHREKAAQLGCEGGQNYIDTGRVEAFKRMGGLIALIVAYRSGGEGALPLPPLTADEGGLLQAFRAAAAELFGDQMPQFEAMIPALAQQRLSRYPGNADLALARFIEEQSTAFAILHHETLVNNAGWTPRGAALADGSPFGYSSIRVSKDGMAELSLIAAPIEVAVNSDAWGKPVTGFLAIGRRADGSVVAGLAGGTIAGAPASLVVKAQSQGDVLRSVTGTRVMADCPYARCFAFPRDRLAGLVPGASGEPVRFYAAADSRAAASPTRTDGQTVPADRMRGLLQPR